MNFVLNIDPTRPKVATVDVLLRSKYNLGQVTNAEAVYLEFRYDEDTRENYVCLVYRMPAVLR